MKPDLTKVIQREIAQTLVTTFVNESRDEEKLQGGIYYFYPHDFGKVFDALGWDDGCCIEVEVRWTHQTKLINE